MSQQSLAEKPQRLESLDVFRGLTIAGMVLVNNPGTWGAMHAPLQHAQWDGCTPTDLIFPFFLFIVGVSMSFSFDRRLARGDSKLELMAGVAKRSILLILLGFILSGFPNLRLIGPHLMVVLGLSMVFSTEPVLKAPKTDREEQIKIAGGAIAIVGALWFLLDIGHFKSPSKVSNWSAIFPLEPVKDGSYLRIPGVLQRIGVAFFCASLIALWTGLRGRILWAAGILLGYWAVMAMVHAPASYEIGMGGGKGGAPEGAPFPGVLNDWIDVTVLKAHLYSERPDPEGLLSTIPAIATVILGMLTGAWLHAPVSSDKKWKGMLAAAVPLLVLGWLWGMAFPINKKIWSSSYVIYTAGWGLVTFGLCYYLNDVRGWRGWSKPLVVFGTNPILVFFGSGLMARLLSMIKWETAPEKMISLKTWIYSGFEGVFQPGKNASAAFAICYIILWLALTYPLYRNKIFLKV